MKLKRLSILVAVIVLLLAPSASFSQEAETSSAPDKSNSESTEVLDVKEAESNDSDENKVSARPLRDKWALIVGISQFEDKKVPKLKYSSKDANDFYKYLVNEANFKKDHVRILLNEDATRERILYELDNGFLARFAKPDDLVVIFVSTHGSPSELDRGKKNYIVAYDTEVDNLLGTGLEMQRINEIVKRISCDRTLMILDACHSGSVNKNAKGIYRVGNFDAKAMAVGTGQMVICSSSPDQQSWESKRYKNGVFTRKILDNFRKQGTSTPVDKAFENAASEVNQEVSIDYPGKRQNPQIFSSWNGSDLVITVRPTSPYVFDKKTRLELKPDSSPQYMRERMRKRYVTSTREQLQKDVPDQLVLTRQFFSDVPDPEQAYTNACRAQAANFNNPDFYYRKALIQIQLKKYSKAAQTLKGIIRDNPQNYRYYLARGYCYHKMKQHALSSSDIRQAKFTNPILPKKIVFGDD